MSTNLSSLGRIIGCVSASQIQTQNLSSHPWLEECRQRQPFSSTYVISVTVCGTTVCFHDHLTDVPWSMYIIVGINPSSVTSTVRSVRRRTLTIRGVQRMPDLMQIMFFSLCSVSHRVYMLSFACYCKHMFDVLINVEER